MCLRYWLDMLGAHLTAVPGVLATTRSTVMPRSSPKLPCCCCLNLQHVKVGIVGGSDLVKIQEQLGDNGRCCRGTAGNRSTPATTTPGMVIQQDHFNTHSTTC